MSTFSLISRRADEPTSRGAATTAACLFGPPADSGQAEFSASALIPKNAGIYEMFMKSEIWPSEGMSRQLENNI